MGISRLAPSRSASRLLATTVAGIAALAVIALGVRIGTTGLGFDDGRAPATATARPASALVDLAASGGSSDLAATLLALLPPAAPEATVSRGVPQGPTTAPQPDPSGASEPPPVTPAVPDPSEVVPPSPLPPAPAPVPPTTLPPAPGSAPAVEPVTDPVVQAIEDVREILGL